jgi:hypothetical protein
VKQCRLPALLQFRRGFYNQLRKVCEKQFEGRWIAGKGYGVQSYLCLMKTGFPLHFTVRVVPSAIAPTSNSADANASTSADGLILETNCEKFVES